jgi:anti-anti-sigma factor
MAVDPDERRPEFEVRREANGTVPVVAVVGDVDIATATAVQDELRSLSLEIPVVIDLCETSFMDSSGLAVLLGERERRGERLHVACAPAGPVMRLFLAAGVAQPLQIHATRDQALEAARASSAQRSGS